MLGRGGAGVVYKANQLNYSRIVALKVLESAANTTDVARFQRECQSLSKFNHPSIVHFYAWGCTADGAPYLAMEYVEGATLEAIIERDGAFSLARAEQLAVELSDALTYAHTLGVVHRDLKPANVMILKDGHAKLLDFGIAKAVHSDVRITSTDAVIGTPVYMAPEQFMSNKITPATDVYLLGCTLYEALSGKRAFDGTTPFATFDAHARGAYEPLSETVPKHIRDAIAIALDPNPHHRFASAGEFKNAFTNQEKIQRKIPTPRVVARKLPIKFLLSLSCIALVTGLLVYQQHAPPLSGVYVRENPIEFEHRAVDVLAAGRTNDAIDFYYKAIDGFEAKAGADGKDSLYLKAVLINLFERQAVPDKRWKKLWYDLMKSMTRREMAATPSTFESVVFDDQYLVGQAFATDTDYFHYGVEIIAKNAFQRKEYSVAWKKAKLLREFWNNAQKRGEKVAEHCEKASQMMADIARIWGKEEDARGYTAEAAKYRELRKTERN